MGKSFFGSSSGLLSPLKARMFSIPFAAKSSSIKSTSSRVLFMQVRCAMASIPYFFLYMRRYLAGGAVCTVSACTVGHTDICGIYCRKSLDGFIHRFDGKILVGRKTSSENTVLPGVYKSLIFIFFVPLCHSLSSANVYLTVLPLGVSLSRNTTCTFSPASQARSIPLLSSPQSFAGARFATNIIFFPISSSGV